MKYQQLSIFDFIEDNEEPRRIKILKYFIKNKSIGRECMRSQLIINGDKSDPTFYGESNPFDKYSVEYDEERIGTKQAGLYIDLYGINEKYYYTIKEVRAMTKSMGVDIE